MALSGTRTFIHTRDSIIEDAVLPLGIDNILTDTTELVKITRALNTMVLSWQNKGVFLWSVAQNTRLLTQGTASEVFSMYVVSILPDGMFIRRGTTDFPVSQITQEEYDNIADKTQQGKPFQVYVDYQLSYPTVYIYYTPENSTDVLYWREVLKLQDFNVAGDNPDFPVRWMHALITGLTAILAPSYGRSREEIAQFTALANVAFQEAKNPVIGGPGHMQIQPNLRGY